MQNVTNNISSHNQISIEGRGVIDASGMGADKALAYLTTTKQPIWRELVFIYASDTEEILPLANELNSMPSELFEGKNSQQAENDADLEKHTGFSEYYFKGVSVDEVDGKAYQLQRLAALLRKIAS